MKIGLLLPRSVIYTSMSFDLLDGIKASFREMGLEGKHEFISANIGVAGKNDEIYAQCEQLLLQGADIIAGYINPFSAEFIHPLIESSGKTLLVLDSGYHFPGFNGKLSNTYFISLQGNLCCRAIVKKAAEDGNLNFAFTCSLYDAGYRPSYTYSAAAEEKGGFVGFTHVTPLKRSDFTIEPLAQYLQENPDSALLASFCGDMTEDFFGEALKLGIIGATKTYASGFTADEIWLEKIKYPGGDIDCAVPWCKAIDTPQNRTFVNTMESMKEGKANYFSLLGWEAALFIEAAEKQNFDGLTIESPRGIVSIDAETGFTEAPVYYATIIKNVESGNCMLNNVKKDVDLTPERKRLMNDIAFIQNTTANSWLNAYACLES